MIGSCHFVKCKHNQMENSDERCDRMTEKQFTVEYIEDMIYRLGVLIADDSHGLLITTLKKNFFEEYKKFDTITAWECFVDEVNRIESVVELHDFLVGFNKEDWKLLLERFEG